jgi:hypothetical protein
MKKCRLFTQKATELGHRNRRQIPLFVQNKVGIYLSYRLPAKCQYIVYPDVPEHRLPLMSVFVSMHRLPLG